MNRDQFDQLPKIVQAMAEHPIFYDECKNIYKTLSSNVGDCYATMFVQGAWYAWKEQQKKIDKALYAIAQSELHGDRAIWGLQDEIKELLK